MKVGLHLRQKLTFRLRWTLTKYLQDEFCNTIHDKGSATYVESEGLKMTGLIRVLR